MTHRAIGCQRFARPHRPHIYLRRFSNINNFFAFNALRGNPFGGVFFHQPARQHAALNVIMIAGGERRAARGYGRWPAKAQNGAGCAN